jgi:hypothetical protein
MRDRATVNTTILLFKLLDIEKAIGKETDKAILDKVLDAENCLLEMQKERIEHRGYRAERGVILLPGLTIQ